MTRTNPVTVNVCPRLELEALHHQLRELPTRSFLVLKWVWTGEFGKEKKHGDAKFCDSWTLHLSFSDYLKDSLACSLGWNLGYNPRYEHTMADEDVMRYSKRNLDPMPKKSHYYVATFSWKNVFSMPSMQHAGMQHAGMQHAGNLKLMVINR